MIGKIIKSDMKSRISYNITGLDKGILFVNKNTSSLSPDGYEGKCPQGELFNNNGNSWRSSC